MDDFILEKVGSDLSGAVILGLGLLILLPFFWIGFKLFDKAKVDTNSEGGSFALVMFVIVLALVVTGIANTVWGS
jgi:hypothetical protein